MEVAGNAPKRFNIAIVVQGGRLQFEALLFLASLRAATPDFPGRVFLAEPQPGPNWQGDPRVKAQDIRDMMVELGGTFLPFENRHFGQHYPQGNKIEMLRALPRDEPFVFFDTDTLITGDLMTVPFDFTRPRPPCAGKTHGPSRSFTDPVTQPSGNRSMTGSGWTSKAPKTRANRRSIGSDISTSTRVGFFINAQIALGSSLRTTLSQSVTTRPQS